MQTQTRESENLAGIWSHSDEYAYETDHRKQKGTVTVLLFRISNIKALITLLEITMRDRQKSSLKQQKSFVHNPCAIKL